MATLAEVRHIAGELMGIVPYGRAMNAQDDLLLAEVYGQVYAELKSEGIAVWAAANDVPNEVAHHVGALMAFYAAPRKSVDAERYSLISAHRSVAKPEIRRYTTPQYETMSDPVGF
jgi:hypothetical protein